MYNKWRNQKVLLNYQEKRKNHDKIVLLQKTRLDSIAALISKALMGLSISHDEFVSVNNVLREYNETKGEIKNPETSVKYTNK